MSGEIPPNSPLLLQRFYGGKVTGVLISP